MASFAPIRGTRAQIQATPIVDGQFLIETDQGVDNMIYIDEGSTRTIVGGNTVSGVLPELYIYSETGSVVTVEDAGGNVIPTSQVGTDHWTCELPDYGIYTITSVLSGETTTQSIDVNDCMIYTIDASHFHVNVVVTYPSGVGASCQISGGGETYSAPALNPPNTSYKFVVHGKNTTYTITTTVDGAIKTATVTSGTTIDQTYEVAMSYGQINLTVETPPITGDITCTDGVTTIIKPASANMVFYVPNTGTWDISGSDGSIPYSTSAIVTSLSTPVSAGLNTGLNLASWITAGSTTEYPLNPSSYADFSALEADEAAVRQLMTVHASVDYLAQATAGDSLMESVIGSDVCAKWINLSDYALDTLYANTDIADVMDTADKYFYGEWGIVDSTTTPPTWGALGNVPIMTDFSAPYGTCLYDSCYSGNQAYKAFDGNTADYWMSNSNSASGGQYIGYSFPYPVNVRRLRHALEHDDSATAVSTMRVEYSDDNSTWTSTNDTYTIGQTTGNYDKSIDVTDSGYHMHWRAYCQGSDGASRVRTTTLQFYGRELKPLVPTMTANDKPKGEAFASSAYDVYYPWKAFNPTEAAGWVPTGSPTADVYVGYHFDEKTKVYGMSFYDLGYTLGRTSQLKIQGSDDKFASEDVHDLTSSAVSVASSSASQYIPANANIAEYQDARLYLVSTTISLNRGEGFKVQFYGSDYSEKEFAQGSTRKTIYDHGVELETIETKTIGTGAVATKESNQLYISVPSSTGVQAVIGGQADFSSYSSLIAKVGNKFKGDSSFGYFVNLPVSSVTPPTGYVVVSDTNSVVSNIYPTLDISSVNGTNHAMLNAGHNAGGTFKESTITEMWLE